jgi:phage baseplate assembly protein W
MSQEFIGRGFAFPLRRSLGGPTVAGDLRVDATGSLALVSGDRELEEAIRIVLTTAPGERPMRPEFGCRIHDYVFAPADQATAGLVGYEVRAALTRWEPRIAVQDVVVTPDPDQEALLWIDIRYSVRHTNDPRNLVFPFYVIPDEADVPKPAELLVAVEP